MDVIFGFLVEFIATLVAEVIGDLFGPLIVVIAAGFGVYELWPFGVAPHVAIGCSIVAISLIGVAVVMWRSSRDRRRAQRCSGLNDQAGLSDQGSCP